MNVLSLSYGKDSLACFGACEELGIPIDRVVHAEVWATDDIPADLPPMVEFKKKADKIIKERWGLEVEHVCATVSPDRKYGTLTHTHTHTGSRMKTSSTQGGAKESSPEQLQDGRCSEEHGANISSMTKKTYIDVFYRTLKKETSVRCGQINGWPMTGMPWCNSELKMAALKKSNPHRICPF